LGQQPKPRKEPAVRKIIVIVILAVVAGLLVKAALDVLATLREFPSVG
jgi:uncharacterized protein involved in exopolysaccharide biosynthesis